MKKHITTATAIRVARKIGARGVDIEQFRQGLEEELEHKDVTGGDLVLTGKIARAHLRERPDYYTMLKQLEGRASLKDQEKSIRAVASGMKMTIRPSQAIHRTPYRAMNPEAAALLDQKCPKHSILYDRVLDRQRRQRVMDERHEVIEDVAIAALRRLGVPRKRRYRIAHRLANRLQRTIGAENLVRLSRSRV